MPDRRTHRGPSPEDPALFDERALPDLRAAAEDLVWLLNRGYARDASVKLVGDRFRLRARQRLCLLRAVCTDAAMSLRSRSRIHADELRRRALLVDGFNVLTTIEAALGGAVVVCGRDGSYRDLVGAHGNYRRVAETQPAILAAGDLLERLGAGSCLWLFDSPVSNSGRLAGIVREIANDRAWDWSVELVVDPDAVLKRASEIVATSDSVVLDAGVAWCNLARDVIDAAAPAAWVLRLFPDA